MKAESCLVWRWLGIRASRLRNRSQTAMTRSRSSERMEPVLPPESVAEEMALMLVKPASIRLLRITGDPVPPPKVTMFGCFI